MAPKSKLSFYVNFNVKEIKSEEQNSISSKRILAFCKKYFEKKYSIYANDIAQKIINNTIKIESENLTRMA